MISCKNKTVYEILLEMEDLAYRNLLDAPNLHKFMGGELLEDLTHLIFTKLSSIVAYKIMAMRLPYCSPTSSLCVYIYVHICTSKVFP